MRANEEGALWWAFVELPQAPVDGCVANAGFAFIVALAFALVWRRRAELQAAASSAETLGSCNHCAGQRPPNWHCCGLIEDACCLTDQAAGRSARLACWWPALAA